MNTQATVSLKEYVTALVAGLDARIGARLDGIDRATVLQHAETAYRLEALNNAYRIQVQRDSTYLPQTEYRPAHEALRSQLERLTLDAQQRPTAEAMTVRFNLVRTDLLAAEARQQEALALLRKEMAVEKSRSDTNYGRLGAISAVAVIVSGLVGSLLTNLIGR